MMPTDAMYVRSGTVIKLVKNSSGVEDLASVDVYGMAQNVCCEVSVNVFSHMTLFLRWYTYRNEAQRSEEDSDDSENPDV